MSASSLASRVAWAALGSAGLAGAIAAAAASGFADVLVLRATDRHLLGAATELARELDARDGRSLEDVVRDEQEEATSTGIRFAVYGSDGRRVVGNLSARPAEGCTSTDGLRACGAPTRTGERVVAATLREAHLHLLVLAALAGAALAAAVAWAMARLFARRALEPLARLQARIADLPLDGAPARTAELGPDEGIAEADELRRAIRSLHARMRDALDRSSRFAASAAHELRTPLTTLRAELELLEAGAEATDGAEARTSVRTALRKVTQLQSLTERLLLLAAPAWRGGEVLEIVSLRDVIDEALAGLAEADRARVMVADDADVFVRGDLASLCIVLSNGLSNALKFAEHAVVELVVDEESAILAIDDDGPGVPEADRTIVFEPFARGSTAGLAPGHGLGLALVAHVARCHGGDARFEASRHAPRGARLEVRLPRAAPTRR